MRKDSGSGFVTPFAMGPCPCGLCRPRRTDDDAEYQGLDERLRNDRSEPERDAWDGSPYGWRGSR